MKGTTAFWKYMDAMLEPALCQQITTFGPSFNTSTAAVLTLRISV
jgi:hypothetical protein